MINSYSHSYKILKDKGKNIEVIRTFIENLLVKKTFTTLDGVLIANDVVDWWKKSRRKGLILKLDFQKAHDTVNWNFLIQMLSNFGFGAQWMNWIRTCISSAKVFVLVNGSPTPEFCPQKGLRQCDPLSPFLFNVVAEGLTLLVTRAKGLGLV